MFETQLMVSQYNCETMLDDYTDATKGPDGEPGVGGQAYIPTMLDKIRKIRGWIVEKGLDIDIEVDGGVKADWTIAQCAEAGANCFIAGSGMFKYDDLSEGCEALRKVASAAQKGHVLPEGEDISWLKGKCDA